MKNNSMGIIILAVVVGIGIGFFGGIKYSEYQRTQARGGNRQFGTGLNGQAQGAGRGAGRPVIGDVISRDDKSITVKLTDGGSRIIILTGSTTYSKTSDATLQDVVVGQRVGVFGTDNQDKSMTAQNVQLNPQFRTGSENAQPAPSQPAK